VSTIRKLSAPSTDPNLWTVRRAFGVAGGPDEVVLTDEGRARRARAFSVGAQVRRGKFSEALQALAAEGGEGVLSKHRSGARYDLAPLGKFDQIAWGYLRELGYIESTPPEHGTHGGGVRLTPLGKARVERGYDEQKSLLERCELSSGLVKPPSLPPGSRRG
jgi:hypothetical protein